MRSFNLKDFVFLEDHWLFDLAVCSVLGGWLGNTIQLLTISEFENPGNLPFLGALVGVVSYLAATVVGLSLSRKIRLPTWKLDLFSLKKSTVATKPSRLPSWVWVVGIGTVFFVIGNNVILVAWKSVDPAGTGTTAEQMISLILAKGTIGRVFVGLVMFFPVFILAELAARVIAFAGCRGYYSAAGRLRRT